MPEGASILVVDDEEIVRRSCMKVLTKDRQKVVCASDGWEGLGKARSGVFDVVLVDLKMPALDGIGLLKAIRAEKSEVAVVIITGYPSVPTAIEAMKLGAFDYITKPFTPEELSSTVDRAIEHKRSSVGPASLSNCRIMTFEELPRFVTRVMDNFAVWAPKKKGGSFVFDRIADPSEMTLEYPSTILPPKKLFYPQRQLLMRYTMGKSPVIGVPEEEPGRHVVMGVHPCDLHALNLLDTVMGCEYDDPVYRERRKRTLMIGVDCEPQDSCFCSSMGTNEPPPGTDLFLTALDGRYIIEMGTHAGERFVGEYGDTSDATAADMAAARHYRDRKRDKMKRSLDPEGLGEIIHDRFRDAVWEEIAEKCLGCASCSLVCPTCYCFNVLDTVSLYLSSGGRERHWDSCILEHFALVAGGLNFRKSRGDRFRNWYYHKFKGLPEVCGVVGCVGCGRCITSCPAGIEITEVVEVLRGERDDTK